MSSPRQTLDLAGYVPFYLTAISNAVSRGASRLYLREFGVGIIDWRVMSQLALEPNIMANRISAVIGLDKGAVSRSLQALEKAGLVEVGAGPDPRRRTFALTAEGRASHDRILAVALQREQRLLAGMSLDEVRSLIDLMARMHANVSNLNRDDYDIPPR